MGYDSVLQYLKALWGYDVVLVGEDAGTGKTVYEAGTVWVEEAA